MHSPWNDEVDGLGISPPWIPEGSIFPPEAFETILRHTRAPQVHPIPVTQHNHSLRSITYLCPQPGIRQSMTPEAASAVENSTTCQVPLSTDTDGIAQNDTTQPDSTLPTITVSSSSRVFPVPSVSSQNLLAHVPLAVRRGHKVPTPLCLSPAGHRSSHRKSNQDLYPGIPTPFRGSPSTETPVFQLNHDPSVMSMNLITMCQDLRSRCPPLRPSTPQPVSVFKMASISGGMISISDSESLEEDEWAFARDFLAHLNKAPCSQDAVTVPIEESATRRSDPDASDTNEMDSFSWANTETFSDTIEEDNVAVNEACVGPTPKQKRRTTVIIETPKDAPKTNTRVTLDLSHLPKEHEDGDSRDQHPIPFESPTSAVSFSLDRFSSSTPSRPPSSATMRPPVKGILKGRKSVRFSVVPSMHEYQSDDHPAIETPVTPTFKPIAASHRLPRTSIPYNSKVKLGSPLRQSFLAESPSPEVTLRTYRPRLPKHPAVRAILRESNTSTSPPSPTPSPGLRTPLHPKNDRQSLPVRLKNPSPLGSPKARKSVVVEDIGSPMKLRPALVRKPSIRRMSTVADENNARRENSTPVPSKARSRGSSLRSIFTKFRAS